MTNEQRTSLIATVAGEVYQTITSNTVHDEARVEMAVNIAATIVIAAEKRVARDHSAAAFATDVTAP